MEVKVKFNDINVHEEKEKTLVKILMLKGEKGDTVSAEWGTITGSINNQTDLKNALDSKANQSDMTTALNSKANASDLNNYYTKSQIDTSFAATLGTQDIVDRLDSTADDKVLAASQGKILNDKLEKKPYYFNSVAEMRTYDLKEGDSAITLGYYSANDGGGSEYKIKSSSTNYYETLNNNLVAELSIKGTVFVEQFGAKGDGITDDKTFIQNAINSNSSKIILSKEYYVSSNINVEKTKEICGNGKIIVPSYESTDNNPLATFRILSDNTYIHEIEVEADAVDQIPYLNLKAGLSNGYASNRVAFSVTGDNVRFENIITNKVGSFYLIGADNFYINNCNLKLTELGFFIDNGSGIVENVKIEQNSVTDSIYYHPFYVPQISSVLKLQNIEVDVNGSGTINDVLHIYNASNSGVVGGELYVDNLKVLTNLFSTFMQINNSKAYLNRIYATVTTRILSLASNNTVVSVDINNSILEKTEDNESSFIFKTNGNVNIINSIIKAVNNRICSDDILFKDCKLYYSKKFSAGYSGYNLMLENCYIESAGYTRLIGTNGNFKYINCHFRNTDNTSTTCQYNATTDNVGLIMNCIFENVNALFTGTYTNIPYSVKYLKISDNKWYLENNEITTV